MKLKLSELQSKLLKQGTILPNNTNHQQLIPFLRASFSFYFHSLTYIDFPYRSQIYYNHASWVNDILPTINLLVSYFRLKQIFLSSHRYISNPCLIKCFTSQLQVVSSSGTCLLNIYSLILLGIISVALAPFFIYLHTICHLLHYSLYSLLYPLQIPLFGCIHFLIPNPSTYLRIPLTHFNYLQHIISLFIHGLIIFFNMIIIFY